MDDKMDDIEITKRCAERMELSDININGGEVVIGVTPNRYVYAPLLNDAQAMALVKEVPAGYLGPARRVERSIFS